MTILRFLFGTGWWICWYVAFWFIILISVVIWLIMFGSEVKPAGQKPNTPSPASIIVVMIALGLGLVTLVDGLLFARVVAMPLWLKIVLPIVAALGVCASMFPVNILLATHQSYPALWLNVALCIALVGANLMMLHHARTRPSNGMTASDALPVALSIVVPVLVATVLAIKVPESPST
jgi:hypothetical protein